jgi:hypothetical protein
MKLKQAAREECQKAPGLSGESRSIAQLWYVKEGAFIVVDS